MKSRKLNLNKVTVATLRSPEMADVRGRATTVYGPSDCCANTVETQCATECLAQCYTPTCYFCETAYDVCGETTVISGWTVCTCGC